MKLQFQRSARASLAAVLSVAMVLSQSACGENAAEDLANVNYEMAGFIGDAQLAIRDCLKLRICKPEVALIASEAIETKANLPQKKVLNELVKRLNENDELVVTAGDKALLVELVTAVASEIVNDPAILQLDSSTRAAVSAAILAIKPLAIQLISLIQKVPTQKKIAPTLREQLKQSAQVAERWRGKNDALFNSIVAEVCQ